MDTKFAQAIHMLVFIAETDRVASSQALASSIGTNASHTRKLAGLLKQARLIDSQQGKAGFILLKPTTAITLADIYSAVYPDKQLFAAHTDPNPECPVGKHIGQVLAPTFTRIEQDLEQALGSRTLRDFIAELYDAARG
ncbi:Rrf2 family transcriptional regulator [Corynebacterium lizhenjunii]|uniref:Rrf2 family transcriptional regulator n=1 Tax=Corynebacterium lizhenjunii TaxID=2709394 RepID=A0A7T0PBS3_9CORY|nr:Rrf2 family transcriptional regulator [Corynebacterium lizhenjunii]QPK79725.1 Rrf2 family transcriptional regulator [Corynebacterium lizhenjunii]